MVLVEGDLTSGRVGELWGILDTSVVGTVLLVFLFLKKVIPQRRAKEQRFAKDFYV